MKLLAIDAATEACSVALSFNGEIYEEHFVAPRGHAQHLLSMVDRLLSAADISLSQLDAIAFDRGPGSFTGIRVGTSVTQGLAFGADLPVIPVSSLLILAQGVYRELGETQVLSVIDARMDEVYWACHRLNNGVMELLEKEYLSQPDEVTSDLEGKWYGAGTGWAQYGDILSARLPKSCAGIDGQRLPRGCDILPLAEIQYQHKNFVSAEQALPVYLRNEVAKKPSRVL